MKTGQDGNATAAARPAESVRLRLLEASVSAIPDYVYGFGRDRRFVFVNAAMERLYGRPAAEVVGRTLFDLDYPEDLAERLNGHIDTIFATGETIRGEVYYESPAGTAAWFDYVWGPVLGADGQVEAVVGVSRDTTERRRLEDEVRASEERQGFLLKLSDALRPLSDPADIQVAAVRLLAEHLDVMRATFFEVDADGDGFVLTARYERNAPPVPERMRLSDFGPEITAAYRAGQTLVFRDTETETRLGSQPEMYRGLGLRAWIATPLVKDGQLIAVVGVNSATARDWTDAEVQMVEDVAERTWAAVEQARAEAAQRLAEDQALAASEAARVQITATLESISDAFYALDADFRLTYVNARAEAMWGRPRETLIGRDIWSEFPEAVGGTPHAYHLAVMRDRRPAQFEAYSPVLDRWTEANLYPDPVSGGLACYFRDITERRAAEAALRESEARLAGELADAGVLQAISNKLMSEPGANGHFTDIVEAARILMRSRAASVQELHGDRLKLMAHCGFHPDSATFWEWVDAGTGSACGLALAAGDRVFLPDIGALDAGPEEMEAFRKSGIAAAQSTPLVARSGQIVGMMSTQWAEPTEEDAVNYRFFDVLARLAADFIERTRAEQALRESEERLASLVKAAPVGIALIDVEGRVTLANEAYRILVPRMIPSRDETEVRLWRAWDADGAPVARTDWPSARGLRGETVFPGLEMLYGPEDGPQVWKQVNAQPLYDAAGNITGVVSAIADIDALKRSQAVLREREAELARVQEIGAVAGFDIDLTTLTTPRRSPEYRRLHGLPARVVSETHDDWLKRVHPEDRAAADAAVREAIASGATRYHSEYRIVRPKDKSVRWILAKGDIERDGDGRPVRMVGAHIDITERKQAEEAVRLSEHRLARVLESISDGLIVVAADGLVTFVNAAAQQMLAAQGVDTDALVGRDYRETLAPIAGVLTQGHFEEVMDDRQAFEFEFRHEDWDMWFSVRAFPVREGGISIYFHDITAAKAAEAALRDSRAELQRTLDSISDAFLIVDTDWRFTYLNAAVRHIWAEHGVDAGEMIGKDVRTAFDGVAGTVFEKELRRTLVLRIPTRFEFHYAPWDRWYSCRCYPIVGNGASLYLLDITERKAMEQGLRASEDYLNRLVESIGNELVVLDTEWRYRFMNAGARATAAADGHDPETMLGQSVWDVYPRLQGTPFEDYMRAAMYDRVASSFELEHGDRWLMMNVFPIAGDGITVYAQDITALKQMETALRDSDTRWRTLTDAMPQIVWIGRADTGECTYVNDQGVRYTGAPAEAFLGHGWAHFVHPDDRDRAREEWRQSFERGEIFDVEYRMRRFDGQFRWFKVRGAPMTGADGRARLWYGTCTDIQDMMEARFRAESADRAKSEFLANISHEIRTPLNAIVGLTSIMLQFDADPQTHRRYLSTMKDSAASLTELIGDVLDYARIDFGMADLHETEFRLRALLEEVMRIAAVRADEKGLRTELHADVDPDLVLIGDSLRIRQILMNLTANAVKFTETGLVALHAAVTPAGDGRLTVTLTVKDTGIGIPAAQQERVFDKFTQADSSITRRFGGTGLGLTISRRLAEIMGGGIAVESTPGEGSAFTVTLPLRRAETAPAAGTRPATTGEARRVLVVEDNPVNVMVAADMLRRLGHSFEVAENGRAALKAWRDGVFDTVLMDLQMPDLDGVQTARRIRQMERAANGKPVTIIAVTAHALEEDRERCLAAGMNDYLTKPFTMDDLAEKIG